MDARQRNFLETALANRGLPGSLADQLEWGENLGEVITPVKFRMDGQDGVANFTVYAHYPEGEGLVNLLRFDISLRKELEIPDVVVHGIRTRELEARMASIDWKTTTDTRDSIFFNQLFEDLWGLSDNDHPIGLEVQDKLVLKYLADTAHSYHIADLDQVRARHEIQRSFDYASPIQFTPMQAYNLLVGRPVAIEVQDDLGERSIRWVGPNTLETDIAGGPVLQIHPGSEKFDVERAILDSLYGPYLEKIDIRHAVGSLKEGNATVIRPLMDGELKTIILLAEPWNDRVKEDWERMEKLGLAESFDQERLIAQQTPENEAKIAALDAKLYALEFREFDRQSIREGVYFDEKEIEILTIMTFSNDLVKYRIMAELRGDGEEYTVARMTASLKKEILLPDVLPGHIVKNLENRFQEIDWSAADYVDDRSKKIRLLDKVEADLQLKVDRLLYDLSATEFVFPDGLSLKEKLLFKYLLDTPNEGYIPDLGRLSKKFMVGYHFEGYSHMQVGASEAYQLLDGKLVPCRIDKDIAPNDSPGLLVLRDVDNKLELHWLWGLLPDQLSRELDLFMPDMTSYDKWEMDAVPKLERGEAVFVNSEGSKTPYVLQQVVVNREVKLIGFGAAAPADPLKENEQLKEMITRLERLGISGFEPSLMRHINNGDPVFTLEYNDKFSDGKMNYRITIDRDVDDARYRLGSVDASLMKKFLLPDVRLEGLNCTSLELEYSMLSIEWDRMDYYQWGADLYDVTPPGDLTNALFANEKLKDLEQLRKGDNLVGQWVAEALAFNFLAGTPSEGFIRDIIVPQRDYSIDYSFRGAALERLTIDQMHNLLEGRSVKFSETDEGVDQWYKMNFEGLSRSRRGTLEEVMPIEGWDIARQLDFLMLAPDTDYDKIYDRLENGDLVELKVELGGTFHSLSLRADPQNERLVFEPSNVDAEIATYLSVRAGWGFHMPLLGEYGQDRDYSIHPQYFNQERLAEVLISLNGLSFADNCERQAKLYLQIGYPEFELVHQENLTDAVAISHIRFEEKILGGRLPETRHLVLTDYQLSVATKNQEDIKLLFGIEGHPLFPYPMALNLAAGRAVFDEKDPKLSSWYIADLTRYQKDGSRPLQKYSYHLLKIADQLDKMNLTGPLQARVERLQDLIRGKVVSAHREIDGKVLKGVVLFDVAAGKVKFLYDSKLSVEQSQKQGASPDSPVPGKGEENQVHGRKR